MANPALCYQSSKFSDVTVQIRRRPDSSGSVRPSKRQCTSSPAVYSPSDDGSLAAELPGHKIIFFTASEYFKALMEWNSSIETICIKVHEHQVPAAQAMVYFIYHNAIPKDISTSDISQLLILSDEYQVASCPQQCVGRLIQAMNRCRDAQAIVEVCKVLSCLGSVTPVTKDLFSFLCKHSSQLQATLTTAARSPNSLQWMINALREIFQDLERMWMQEEFRKILHAFPAEAIKGLLEWDELQVTSENVVVTVAHLWIQARKEIAANSVTPRQVVELVGIVRTPFLSESYLTQVYPQLSWIKSVPQHTELMLHGVRAMRMRATVERVTEAGAEAGTSMVEVAERDKNAGDGANTVGAAAQGEGTAMEGAAGHLTGENEGAETESKSTGGVSGQLAASPAAEKERNTAVAVSGRNAGSDAAAREEIAVGGGAGPSRIVEAAEREGVQVVSGLNAGGEAAVREVNVDGAGAGPSGSSAAGKRARHAGGEIEARKRDIEAGRDHLVGAAGSGASLSGGAFNAAAGRSWLAVGQFMANLPQVAAAVNARDTRATLARRGAVAASNRLEAHAAVNRPEANAAVDRSATRAEMINRLQARAALYGPVARAGRAANRPAARAADARVHRHEAHAAANAVGDRRRALPHPMPALHPRRRNLRLVETMVRGLGQAGARREVVDLTASDSDSDSGLELGGWVAREGGSDSGLVYSSDSDSDDELYRRAQRTGNGAYHWPLEGSSEGATGRESMEELSSIPIQLQQMLRPRRYNGQFKRMKIQLSVPYARIAVKEERAMTGSTRDVRFEHPIVWVNGFKVLSSVTVRRQQGQGLTLWGGWSWSMAEREVGGMHCFSERGGRRPHALATYHTQFVYVPVDGGDEEGPVLASESKELKLVQHMKTEVLRVEVKSLAEFYPKPGFELQLQIDLELA